jgi:hypothetical protein
LASEKHFHCFLAHYLGIFVIYFGWGENHGSFGVNLFSHLASTEPQLLQII